MFGVREIGCLARHLDWPPLILVDALLTRGADHTGAAATRILGSGPRDGSRMEDLSELAECAQDVEVRRA